LRYSSLSAHANVYQSSGGTRVDALLTHGRLVQAPTHHSEPITEANADCERLCTNQSAFNQATDHLGIPQRYIDLIWEAIVTVPNHEKVVEALAVQLQQPRSFTRSHSLTKAEEKCSGFFGGG
jgi:hypothetical protein